MDSLLMMISNTLWDMVRHYSGKDCPRCKDGDLAYIILEIEKNKEKKLALECWLCGYVGNVDGTEWDDGPATAYLVNQDGLRAFR